MCSLWCDCTGPCEYEVRCRTGQDLMFCRLCCCSHKRLDCVVNKHVQLCACQARWYPPVVDTRQHLVLSASGSVLLGRLSDLSGAHRNRIFGYADVVRAVLTRAFIAYTRGFSLFQACKICSAALWAHHAGFFARSRGAKTT